MSVIYSVLFIIVLISLIVNILLALNQRSIKKIDGVISENEKLKEEILICKKEKMDILSISKGSKVLFKAKLFAKSTQKSFLAYYEASVLESTKDKLKINTINVTSPDDKEFVVKYKSEVLKFHDGDWVDRSSCEVFIDIEHIRDYKLDILIS